MSAGCLDYPGSGHQRQHGFSLVELAVSVVLVGIVLIAALTAAGSAARSQHLQARQRQAATLAQHLTSEILQARYEDPDGSGVFGPDSGEDTGTRNAFDDVDDYHDWSATPPQFMDGTAVANSENWQRAVSVEYVEPDDPGLTSGTDTGLKRITVTVTDPMGRTTTLVTLRSGVGAFEQVPALETTFVTWVGVELQIGDSDSARVNSGVATLNHLQND